MCLPCRNCSRLIVLLCVLPWLGTCARQGEATPARKPLRVCADPNNLPFSNQRLEGFENKIADLLAGELRTTVQYTWRAQRRGFIRETLKAGACDVVMGVPRNLEPTLTSLPYYRSTYVFVTRKNKGVAVRSFDDPALKRLRIGVQLIGDDGANSPPVHALAQRGVVNNLRGYTVYGDYREDSPPARIIDAVARGEVDVAVVWGPLAGYFAPRQGAPLTIVPVAPGADSPALPMVYDISLGVRRGERELLNKLEAALESNRAAVQRLLREYGVPEAGEVTQ